MDNYILKITDRALKRFSDVRKRKIDDDRHEEDL